MAPDDAGPRSPAGSRVDVATPDAVARPRDRHAVLVCAQSRDRDPEAVLIDGLFFFLDAAPVFLVVQEIGCTEANAAATADAETAPLGDTARRP